MEGIGGIWMLWMDDRISMRQVLWHRVVVRYYDIYSHCLGHSDGLIARDTIVHRDNQRNTLLLDKVLVDTLIGTIAVCEAVG